MVGDPPYPLVGSHLPVLITCARALSPVCNILELGGGDCSTTALSRIAKERGDRLYTYEPDQEWGEKLRSKFDHVISPRLPPPSSVWHLALIDHETHDRAPAIRRLQVPQSSLDWAWHAYIIVVHDTEPQSNYIYNWDNALRCKGYYTYNWGNTLRCKGYFRILCPFYGVGTSVLISPHWKSPRITNKILDCASGAHCREIVKGYYP